MKRDVVKPEESTAKSASTTFSGRLGLDHGVGHPMPFGLPHGSPRRTEGHWEYLDCLEDRGKHRAGLLPEKPLRCGGPVTPREEEVVNGREACTFSGVVEAAQLVVSQREVTVSPFHVGA